MSNAFVRFRPGRETRDIRMSRRETSFSMSDCIWPVFVVDGTSRCEAIGSMENVNRISPDVLVSTLIPLVKAGLSSVLLFGVPEKKGIEEALRPDSPVHQAIAYIRNSFPSLEIICDVCICSFTLDGHCHIGDNDATCEILARIACSYAHAGAHTIAPSAMMDGQVKYIRKALDREGFKRTSIMSYAAKFASYFYGPFRDAADCAPKFGNRRGYQMDCANPREALAEIEADLIEGAASIIIKPALAYLDIIQRARQRHEIPLVAYNVSGEYRMLLDSIRAGYAHKQIIQETLFGLKRAGADRIITYFVPYLAQEGFEYED